MPMRPASPCRSPRCPDLAVPGSAYCLTHRREEGRERGSSTAQGYGVRWRKARRAWLSEHPLCAMCMEEGRVEAATLVDHIIPHRGDYELFWDELNWQSLCVAHHSAKTSQEMQDIVY